MEGDCAVPVELSERLKNMLDMLWQDYQCDLIRIARRAEKFKQDYLLPKIMGDGSIPDINEIKRYFQSQQSDPPQLSRIAVQHDLEYIWSQRDIGIVMDRDIANISRNIRAIEKSKSTDRLNACRKLCYLNDTARMYLYTDEIFLLLVSHYAHEYISTRIITRRHGQNTSPEIAAAIWAYWEELCRQNDSVSLRSYLEQNENPSHGLFLSPEIGLDFYFSDIADGSNKDVSNEHTKTSVFVECGKMLLDNKVMAAAVALAVGTPPGLVVAFSSACYGYYILPTYPSDLAALQFDRSGTTHIGRFVINHSFILPGLIGVITATVVGYFLGVAYGYI